MSGLDIGQLREFFVLTGDALIDGYVSYIPVHPEAQCEPPCAFHSPSDHPLRDAPIGTFVTAWGRVLVRICDCRHRHPDPDFELYLHRVGVLSEAISFRHECCPVALLPEDRTVSIPHNPDAEAAVLGAMMLSRPDREAVLGLLSAEDFYAPKHSAIFSAIVTLYGTGHAIEPLSLSLELDRMGMLELVGGKAGLLQIQAESTSSGAMTYARIVADLAARRRLMAFAALLEENAQDPDIDVETTLAQVERASDEVRLPVADVSPARTAGDLAAAATDHEYRWIVPDFLERQDRVGVTGGEGAGKSTLLRQWSVQLASGIHPWFLYPMDPASVLYVDLQDTEAQAGRAFGRMIQVAGEHYDDRRLHVVCWREGIDLRNRRDFRRIDRLMEIHQPDVLVLGPHYKCYKVRSGERSVDEQPAIECSLALDELLARHDAALLMEMHSPHGSGGDREGLRPYGPSLWLRWPEFGFGLKKEPGPASTAPARVIDWRGARDRTRLMPTKFTPTGKWPWSAQLEGED